MGNGEFRPPPRSNKGAEFHLADLRQSVRCLLNLCVQITVRLRKLFTLEIKDLTTEVHVGKAFDEFGHVLDAPMFSPPSLSAN